MCAASTPQSAGFSVPGQRQKELARVPPSHAVPFAPRIQALKTLVPAVPPLSFMKTTSVSFAMPHSSSLASTLPTFWSMLWTMPRKLAVWSFGTLPS